MILCQYKCDVVSVQVVFSVMVSNEYGMLCMSQCQHDVISESDVRVK